MAKTRVLVVEDSLTVRKYLLEVLSCDSDIEVVGEASDGKSGIELCESLRPDVITLDMMLPVMSGLAATEYIMAYCPTPILVVSASTNRGELFKTYEAMGAGAVDVLDKPRGDERDDEWARRFISTVKLVARIKVITHPRARLALKRLPQASGSLVHAAREPRLIAIGVSTGGPAALVEILHQLPADFPIPILVVIHLGKLFAPNFTHWLDGQTPIRVAFAEHGQPVPELGKGGVWMAAPDRHLVVKQGRMYQSDEPERHSCRPSVDLLFSSLAKEMGSQTVACLLTGMGRDGADGLLAIRRAGGGTIAQDEASSVVFGMPREAILLGAAEQVLPLDRIGPVLAALVQGQARRKEP